MFNEVDKLIISLSKVVIHEINNVNDEIKEDEPQQIQVGKKKWKHEEECRRIFEKLLEPYKFPSVRPDWLKSPLTGCNLELDGYNGDIMTDKGQGLAFEYDGKQHKRYVKKFHKTKNDFEYQKERDRFKNKVCKEKGVTLIRIPHKVKYEYLENYIRAALENIKVYEKNDFSEL